MSKLKFWEALRDGYRVALQQDPSVVLMGVGITEPKAVFGTMEGLCEEFGSERFVEGPLSEQMLTGAALGAALMGLRPVLIHRRIDWLPLTMDQIVSSWAKWNFMFGDQQRVGCVVRGVVGRGWGNGPQHSQSLHGLCANVPGLNVVVPGTPSDAKGLTISAIFSDTPTIFIDHRSQHGSVGEVPDGDFRVPIGKAEVLQSGSDVSVVAVGPMVEEALKAAADLHHLGVSTEVINLRTIRPIDFAAIEVSVRKTGRLIVADSDWPHYGVAATIVAEMTQRVFSSLKHAPQTVTWPDHSVPASYGLEDKFYPGSNDIVNAISAQLSMRSRVCPAETGVQHSVVVAGPF